MSTFVDILRQMCPDYDRIADALMDGPKIKPILHEDGTRWRITLEEVWNDPIVDTKYQTSTGLDEKVDWTTSELDKWSVARRLAWDTWQFPTRKDAEKFQTLYNLRWASE